MSEKTQNVNDVFKAKVKELLALHPNQWNGDGSAEVVRAILSSLKDDKGNPVALSALEKDVITLICRPTSEVQLRVLKRIIEAHNARADADTEKCINRVYNATKFTAVLKAGGYIKESDTGESKDLLD